MEDISLLVQAVRGGDPASLDRLFAAVYHDLRALARNQVRRSADRIGATSLVHQAYERMSHANRLDANDREHFFAIAARAMRQIVIDHARRREAAKRGGGAAEHAQDLDDLEREDVALPGQTAAQMIELDQALQRLAALDPALVKLVEMRFFAGLELSEIALLTQRSERSLKRDWRKARAVLHAAMGDSGALPDD